MVQVAYFCDDPNDDSEMGLALVYSAGHPVLTFHPYEDVATRMSALHPTAYDVYIRLRRERAAASPSAGDPPHEPYDLSAAPVDVCFDIRGADGMFSPFWSNVVRVPAEAIAAAVARPGAPP